MSGAFLSGFLEAESPLLTKSVVEEADQFVKGNFADVIIQINMVGAFDNIELFRIFQLGIRVFAVLEGMRILTGNEQNRPRRNFIDAVRGMGAQATALRISHCPKRNWEGPP